MRGGKYLSARDIWDATGSLKKIDKTKDKVQPGDIVAFGGTHVEIVTKVDGNSFCSIGAGRGGNPYNIIGYKNGTEECGWTPPGLQNRYIDNEKIRFRRVL